MNPETNPEKLAAYGALDVAIRQVLSALSDEEKIQIVNGTMLTYPVMLGRDSNDKPEYAMMFLSLRKEDIELKAKAAAK